MKKLFVLMLITLMGFSGCGINIDFGSDEEVEEVAGEIAEEGDEAVEEEEAGEEDVDDEESDEEIDEDVDENDDSDEEDLLVRGEEDISDIEIFKKYYKYIEDGELKEAYDMKYNPSMTFATFKGWYQNTNDTYAYDFEEVSLHKYQFTVELFEENEIEETFFVVTEIVDGSIKNISSTKTWDNYSPEAFTKKINGKTNIYVRDGGVEKWVVEVDDATDSVVNHLEIEDYRLVRGGDYLVYELLGWEVRITGIFDVAAGKEVRKIVGSGGDYGFTSNGKYFYQCASDGMHGGYMEIYNVPGFDIHKNLMPSGADALMHTCHGYNSGDATYRYSISFNGFSNPQVRTYHFDTGIID